MNSNPPKTGTNTGAAHIWVYVGSFLFVAGFALPFLSLPLFNLGYWQRTGALNAGFFLLSMLAAWLLVFWPKDARAQASQTGFRPFPQFVVLSLLMALCSVVLAFFNGSLWSTIVGAPQSMMGAGWFLAFGVWGLLAARLLSHRQAIYRVLAVGLTISLGIAALKAWDWYHDELGRQTLLIWIAAYYGWLAFPFMAWLPAWGRSHILQMVVIVATIAILAAVSGSIALAFGAVVGLGVWAMTSMLCRTRLSASLIRAGSIAVIGVISLAPLVLPRLMPGLMTIASLADRQSLMRMILQDLLDASPVSWLTGFGWGETAAAFQRNLTESGMTLWDGSWIFMESDYFHSHHAWLESLHAMGIVGPVFMFAIMVIPVLFCRQDLLPQACGFAIAQAIAFSMWFPLAFYVPVAALAYARFARAAPSDIKVLGLGGSIKTLLALLITLCSGLVLLTLREAEQVKTWIEAPAESACHQIDARSDIVLAAMIRDQLNQGNLNNDSEKAAVLRACLAERIPVSSAPLLAVTGLSFMVSQQTTDQPASVAIWQQWLDHALVLMPRRSDLAISFLTAALQSGNDRLVHAYVARFLAADSSDSVGHYFNGILQLRQGDRDKGIASLIAAADLGIQRFMPLDPRVQAIIQANRRTD